MRQLQILRDPKRLLPILIGSVVGVFVLLDRLFPNSAGIADVSSEILSWVGVLAAFALLAGLLNVVFFHLRRLRGGDKRWPYSIALLVGVAIPPVLALYGYYAQGQPANGPLFQSFIRWVYTPLSVSLLALLTFFALTAAVRALGSGNREAIVLVLVAIVMLILQLPLMAALPFVGDIVAWIQRYLALAGLRGLVLGAAIGAIIASIRILLGLDRPYLDR